MTKDQKKTLIKSYCSLLRKRLSIILVAIMLGISNVILEEDRMVNDTRAKIEVLAVQPEDD